MKKLLTLAAVVILILGLTTASYAVEFRANGFLKNLTALGVNLGWPPPRAIPAYSIATQTAYNRTFAWNVIWTHLDFTVEASEDLKGVIAFEAGPAEWGSIGGHGGWYPGATANVYQAYTDFKIPGTDAFPTRLVVGLQPWWFTPPFAIGEYGPGVRINSTVGPAAISLFWRKMDENALHRSDDMDSYGASVNVPAGPVSISVWEMYYKIRENAEDAITYGPLPAGNDADGFHSYTGIGMRGTFGPVMVTGDFVYGMRDVSYHYDVGTFDGEENKGWVGRVTAAIPVGMFTVGADFCYATGDDKNDVANKREQSGYKYPIPATGGINVASLLDAGLVFYPSGINVFPALTNGPLGNWHARAFAQVKPLDWLTLKVSGMYIADNVDNGDLLGTAVDSTGALEDNSDIGIELDLVTSIKIYDNLTYEIGAGYLMAGDALDQYTGVGTINDSPDDPWVILSGLTYFF